jgi:hypothetical protein
VSDRRIDHAARAATPESSALVIRRRRPIGEPAPAHPVASSLAGTAGAGRLALLLAESGLHVGPITQLVIDADAPADALADLDAGRTFHVVVLGSHLVNTTRPDNRAALLQLAARHAAAHSTVLVEHHPLDWAETAEPTVATPGATLGMVDVRRDPPFVSAVSVYDVGGRVMRQPFTARVLSDDELDEALLAAGLRRIGRRGPTLLEAQVGG